jgi:hypothetical protein
MLVIHTKQFEKLEMQHINTAINVFVVLHSRVAARMTTDVCIHQLFRKELLSVVEFQY